MKIYLYLKFLQIFKLGSIIPIILHRNKIDDMNRLYFILAWSSYTNEIRDVIIIKKLIILINDKDIYLDKCFPTIFVE